MSGDGEGTALTGNEPAAIESGPESVESIPEEIESMIGDQLRAFYDGVLAEPIPNSILELLGKLGDIVSGDDGDDSSAR